MRMSRACVLDQPGDRPQAVRQDYITSLAGLNDTMLLEVYWL